MKLYKFNFEQTVLDDIDTCIHGWFRCDEDAWAWANDYVASIYVYYSFDWEVVAMMVDVCDNDRKDERFIDVVIENGCEYLAYPDIVMEFFTYDQILHRAELALDITADEWDLFGEEAFYDAINELYSEIKDRLEWRLIESKEEYDGDSPTGDFYSTFKVILRPSY